MNKFIFGVLVAGAVAAVGYVAAQAIKGKKSSTGYDDDDYVILHEKDFGF